jgi:Ni2+-binding GTPase involved in maturation of urease and hydrogenase
MMLANNLKITVSGKAGSGKSTIIELIDRILKEHGFDTEVNHLDIPADQREKWLENLDKRVEDMKTRKKTMILVEQTSSRNND